jgi:hypothetical protein
VREFFRGWRRKAGLLMLAMALLLTAAWMKSCRYYDRVRIQTDSACYCVQSMNGTVCMWRGSGRWFAGGAFGWSSVEIIDWSPIPTDGYFQYWKLVLPLTLLSGYLILWKPRKAKAPP